MLTGIQIKAARTFLGWSQRDLCANTGLSIASVRRIEGTDGLPPVTVSTLEKVEKTFKDWGLTVEQSDHEQVIRLKDQGQ